MITIENKQTLLYEYDSLIQNIKPVVAYSLDINKCFCKCFPKEVVYVETVLAKFKRELSDVKLRINELYEKEQQISPRILDLIADTKGALPQNIKQTYEMIEEIKANLAVAREREVCLQSNYNELELRLQNLHDTQEINEELSSEIDKVAVEFSRMYEIIDKIQVLIQSQIFGLKVIKAQEDERRRVSREMHDGPAQTMANVVFLAEVCEKLIDIDSARAKIELKELREQVFGCLDEIRKIVFDLRPMALDDLGLIPTVKRIADILKERMGIKINVKISGEYGEQLDSYIEASLFRIIQECLNNIEKHSRASEAQIAINIDNNYVVVMVEDNGDGFDISKPNNDCFGLLGMRERVSLLNGQLTINSQKAQGTKIVVKIPLPVATEIQELI